MRRFEAPSTRTSSISSQGRQTKPPPASSRRAAGGLEAACLPHDIQGEHHEEHAADEVAGEPPLPRPILHAAAHHQLEGRNRECHVEEQRPDPQGRAFLEPECSCSLQKAARANEGLRRHSPVFRSGRSQRVHHVQLLLALDLWRAREVVGVKRVPEQDAAAAKTAEHTRAGRQMAKLALFAEAR
eukprot:CAMPEP_0117526488 /NCGR_PEP_ID=MMETSP0784-20121206/36311_1 /TAXON_ID=39447 /ORGANISM="" /LENGTH=184 /DNA_ID=CAMNT_0005322717 /DNA_START=223 /DNA_END=778 /DNA_ORIENTATION=+